VTTRSKYAKYEDDEFCPVIKDSCIGKKCKFCVTAWDKVDGKLINPRLKCSVPQLALIMQEVLDQVAHVEAQTHATCDKVHEGNELFRGLVQAVAKRAQLPTVMEPKLVE